jgi:glycosyltransferase involved in cell wall biosynthesis
MLIPTVAKPETAVQTLSDTKWKKKMALGRFVAERLFFYPQEKNSSVRFAFSPAEVGADISTHPLVLEADVIHLHWINFGFLSLDSLDKLFSLGKPIVWTLHDMWTFTGGCHYSRGCHNYLNHCHHCPYLAKPDQYDISFTQFEKKIALYNKTKMALISPSKWLDSLVKTAALTKNIFSKAIPNCVDTDLFKSMNQKQARQAMQLPVEKKLLLFAGANTQDPRKGFIYFREAVNLLNDKAEEKYEVLIFGKSNPASFALFPAKVHYLGKITKPGEMVAAYNAADAIVVPSLEDNLPNTIMEAMSCGTPVVGFRTGGIPEMIDHQRNGYLSEIKSSPSLAAGINWVLANNREGIISNNARQKVMEFYSEKIVTRQYQDVYESLLKD